MTEAVLKNFTLNRNVFLRMCPFSSHVKDVEARLYRTYHVQMSDEGND